MTSLTAAAARLEQAATSLRTEQDRDGGPRPAEVRKITDLLYTVTGDLLGVSHDLDAGRTGGP